MIKFQENIYFCYNHFRTVRQYAEMMLNLTVAAEASEVSMLWYLWYVAEAYGGMSILATSNGAQVYNYNEALLGGGGSIRGASRGEGSDCSS